MAKATVYNQTGEKVKEVDLNPKVFGLEIKPELIQQAVVSQQANQRQNLAHTKGRGEIRGGGRKPWRQKGTGRARHGSIRSPLWRGGGITFGPTKDQNYSLKINKKAKRKAILMSLSDKANNQKIILLDKLELEEAKTKKFFKILQNLKLREAKAKKTVKKEEKVTSKKIEKSEKTKKSREKGILLVLPKKDEKVQRAARNIPRLVTIQANSLNVLAVLQQQYLLMPLDSLAEIEKTFVSAASQARLGAKG
ncbi:MAG: 50S ribosomal protein L4 [Patescibacteria group bacterium]|jgi:large subunit ribosomal protein L4